MSNVQKDAGVPQALSEEIVDPNLKPVEEAAAKAAEDLKAAEAFKAAVKTSEENLFGNLVKESSESGYLARSPRTRRALVILLGLLIAGGATAVIVNFFFPTAITAIAMLFTLTGPLALIVPLALAVTVGALFGMEFLALLARALTDREGKEMAFMRNLFIATALLGGVALGVFLGMTTPVILSFAVSLVGSGVGPYALLGAAGLVVNGMLALLLYRIVLGATKEEQLTKEVKEPQTKELKDIKEIIQEKERRTTFTKGLFEIDIDDEVADSDNEKKRAYESSLNPTSEKMDKETLNPEIGNLSSLHSSQQPDATKTTARVIINDGKGYTRTTAAPSLDHDVYVDKNGHERARIKNHPLSSAALAKTAGQSVVSEAKATFTKIFCGSPSKRKTNLNKKSGQNGSPTPETMGEDVKPVDNNVNTGRASPGSKSA